MLPNSNGAILITHEPEYFFSLTLEHLKYLRVSKRMYKTEYSRHIIEACGPVFYEVKLVGLPLIAYSYFCQLLSDLRCKSAG
ncbi:hypothetical protein D3C85_1725860 [compost metagenome]